MAWELLKGDTMKKVLLGATLTVALFFGPSSTFAVTMADIPDIRTVIGVIAVVAVMCIMLVGPSSTGEWYGFVDKCITKSAVAICVGIDVDAIST